MSYSVQDETLQLLRSTVSRDPSCAAIAEDIVEYVDLINFTGSIKPSIPINWRLSESISALKGLESVFINALLVRKYKQTPLPVEINTDHASLFFMSSLLTDVVNVDGKPAGKGSNLFERMNSVFPDVHDLHRANKTIHRATATNIYKTKDGRFYHTHGSLNPEPTIKALGLPTERDATSFEDACLVYIDKVGQFNSGELDELMNDDNKQAGTIAWTRDEYAASEQGKANAPVGLYKLDYLANQEQKATWWPEVPQTSAKRPLSGLKVLDLTRIIAGPAIGRGLAELGASVMRITAPHVPDMAALHIDLNWGKWNSELDLRRESDKETLKALLADADVWIDGYRPGVMAKYGFGKDDILRMCRDRSRGIIYVRENCYGWQGPWMERSGWQQISDACCGVSMAYGFAMGQDEPVTPVFPNSDYCTGVIGVCGVMNAILERGQKGGSYALDIALNYYSEWLVKSCGEYPVNVWHEVWNSHNKLTFRHYQNMSQLIPAMLKSLFTNSATTLFHPSFFEIRESKASRKYFKVVKPILTFADDGVILKYNIGNRTNGKDKPKWPDDLMTEVIS